MYLVACWLGSYFALFLFLPSLFLLYLESLNSNHCFCSVEFSLIANLPSLCLSPINLATYLLLTRPRDPRLILRQELPQ